MPHPAGSPEPDWLFLVVRSSNRLDKLIYQDNIMTITWRLTQA